MHALPAAAMRLKCTFHDQIFFYLPADSYRILRQFHFMKYSPGEADQGFNSHKELPSPVVCERTAKVEEIDQSAKLRGPDFLVKVANVLKRPSPQKKGWRAGRNPRGNRWCKMFVF